MPEQPENDGRPADRAESRPATGPPIVSSESLLAGGREVVIRHGIERYRLLLTGQNKLILTK